VAESCKGCYHWRGEKDREFCHYLLDTGFPRYSPDENCLYKKEVIKVDKGYKGNKIPESIRKKALEAVNAGIKYSDIARSLKIGASSVRRIAKAAQKVSPEAPTAMENTSEETEVRRSTNNIIPDTEENVKSHYSPYESAVDEAVLERIEKLHDRIAEMQLDISNYENELNVLEEYHLKYLEVQNNGT
jgi:hypothetical protein